ncbi:MAG: universal stress protein [Pseudomonadota bacterium]|nr:universal stress protein [Pseudomonadota bacterium]
MYKRIVVAYDGSPGSRGALRECLEFRPAADAEVHLVGVVRYAEAFPLAGEYLTPHLAIEEHKRRMAAELHSGHALLADLGLEVIDHLEVGEPVEVIAAVVRHTNADLVILGHSRHKSFAARWWRGAVDTMLVDRVRCSVLVARDTSEV